MHTENAIIIHADMERIYSLAAAVERWPDLLPHYRRVRILAEDGRRRLLEMAAHRDGIPVSWQAIQECFPDEPRITFRHVRGVTTGMEVAWTFTPGPRGVAVAIQHWWQPNWPLLGRLVADRLIGRLFVANIAGKTLRQIKRLAEQGVPERVP